MRRIAWLLPKRLVYWVLIRAWAHATTGQYRNTVAPDILMDTVVERWNTDA